MAPTISAQDYAIKFPLHHAVKTQNTFECIKLLSHQTVNPFKRDPDGKMAIDLAYDIYMDTYQKKHQTIANDEAFILKLFLHEHCAIGVDWLEAILPADINLDNCLIAGRVLSKQENSQPIFLRTDPSKNKAIQKRISQALECYPENDSMRYILNNAITNKRHSRTTIGINETTEFNSGTLSSDKLIQLKELVDIPCFLKQIELLRIHLAYLSEICRVHTPNYRMSSPASLEFSKTLGKVSRIMASIAFTLTLLYDAALIIAAFLGRVYREDDDGNLINDKNGNPIPRFDEKSWQDLRLAAFTGNGILIAVFSIFLLGMLFSYLKIAPQQIFLLIDNIKIYLNRLIINKEIDKLEKSLPPFMQKHNQSFLQQEQGDKNDPEIRIENLMMTCEGFAYLVRDPYATLPALKPVIPKFNANSFWKITPIDDPDEEAPLLTESPIIN